MQVCVGDSLGSLTLLKTCNRDVPEVKTETREGRVFKVTSPITS
jgi:hypothetical protein